MRATKFSTVSCGLLQKFYWWHYLCYLVIKKQWIQGRTGGKRCNGVKLASLWNHAYAVGFISSRRVAQKFQCSWNQIWVFFINYTVFIPEVKLGVSRMGIPCIIICYFSYHWWAKRDPSTWSNTTTTRLPDQKRRRVSCGCFLLRSPSSLMVSCPCRDGGYGRVQFHREQCVWHLDWARSSLGSADSGCGLRILRECIPP